MKQGLGILTAGFLCVAGSGVQQGVAAERGAAELRIQVEWIELSHADFTALLEEEASPSAGDKSSNNGPLRSKLQQMVEKGDAAILDTAVVMARSGQRAKVESVREVIYPTKYIPAGSGEKGKQEGGRQPTSESGQEKAGDVEAAALLPTPDAFETRNVGTTLEVDPVLGADGRTVDLSLSPEIVYHVGDEEYGVYREGEGEVVAKTPLFYTMKLTTQVTMLAGEYLFAGVQSPFDAEAMEADRERKVMVFLKADVLFVGPPAKEEKRAGQNDKKK